CAREIRDGQKEERKQLWQRRGSASRRWLLPGCTLIVACLTPEPGNSCAPRSDFSLSTASAHAIRLVRRLLGLLRCALPPAFAPLFPVFQRDLEHGFGRLMQPL